MRSPYYNVVLTQKHARQAKLNRSGPAFCVCFVDLAPINRIRLLFVRVNGVRALLAPRILCSELDWSSNDSDRCFSESVVLFYPVNIQKLL